MAFCRWQAENTLMIPVLKKAAGKYQQLYEKYKTKALKEAAVEKDKLYRVKGKGQWSLANNIGGKTLPPLSAVRRKENGPNGEPIGSIATAQVEVDSIVREAYAKVYKGNQASIEEATQKVFGGVCPIHLSREGSQHNAHGWTTSQGDGEQCKGVGMRNRPMVAGGLQAFKRPRL